MSEPRGDDTAGATSGGTPPRPATDLGLDGYEGYQEIGRGGFSVVYKATQIAFDRTVAIKVISASADEQTLMRFERECRTMGALSDHPSIVTVFGNGRTEKGDLYIIMEFLARGSLADRLTSGLMGWEEVVDVGIRIADALQAAHDGGVLHRDVKPENIFVSKHGEAKLGDFGIARLEGGASTRSGVITASVAHAAPEILDGKRPAESSDVYSLGSTLFTLLAGSPAFTSDTDESIVPMLARIAIDPVPDLRPRGVPGPVCDVLEASMAKKVDNRISTAAEFAQRLREAKEKVQRGEPGATQPVVPILPTDGSGGGSWPPAAVTSGEVAAPGYTGQYDPDTGQYVAAAPTPAPAGPATGPAQYTGQYDPTTGQYTGQYPTGQQAAGAYNTGQYAAGQHTGDYLQTNTGPVYGYSNTGPVPAAKEGGGLKVALIVLGVLAVLGVIGAVAVAASSGGGGSSSSITTTVPVAVTPSTSSSVTTTSGGGGSETVMNSLGLGDCFDHPDLAGIISGGAQSDVGVSLVPCDQDHDMQIVAQDVVRAGRVDPYPSDIDDRVGALCLTGFESYVGTAYANVESTFGVITVAPDEAQWDSGERGFVCAAYHSDGSKLPTSLENSG